MCMRQLIIASFLATADVVQSAVTTSAGKCRPICMEPIPIDFNRLTSLGQFNVVYTTDIQMNRDVDDQVVYVNPITDNSYRIDTTRTYGNLSTLRHTLISTYIDNVIYEDTIDEDGVIHGFRTVPLAITRENAVLYYRCSELGHPGTDTRFILIPNDTTLSDDGLQYLLAVDEKCNFKGKLKKLPKTHNKKLF